MGSVESRKKAQRGGAVVVGLLCLAYAQVAAGTVERSYGAIVAMAVGLLLLLFNVPRLVSWEDEAMTKTADPLVEDPTPPPPNVSPWLWPWRDRPPSYLASVTDGLDEAEAELVAQLGAPETAFMTYRRWLSYTRLGWWLGDRARGLRVTRLLLDRCGDVAPAWTSAAHEHALYLLDDGRPAEAEAILASPEAPAPPSQVGMWRDAPRAMARADALCAQGRLVEAEAAAEEAVAAGEVDAVPYAAGGVGWNPRASRGMVRALRGRGDDAIEDLRAARKMEMGEMSFLLVGPHLVEEARLYARRGLLGRAARVLALLEVVRVPSPPRGDGRTLPPRMATAVRAATDLVTAEHALARGADDEASARARAAIEAWPVSAPVEVVLAAQLVEARIAVRAKQLEVAREGLAAVVERARAAGLGLRLVDAQVLAAHAALAGGDLVAGARAAEEAHARARGEYPWGEAAALHAWAEVELARGDAAAAAHHAAEAVNIRERIRDARVAGSRALLERARGSV